MKSFGMLKKVALSTAALAPGVSPVLFGTAEGSEKAERLSVAGGVPEKCSTSAVRLFPCMESMKNARSAMRPLDASSADSDLHRADACGRTCGVFLAVVRTDCFDLGHAASAFSIPGADVCCSRRDEAFSMPSEHVVALPDDSIHVSFWAFVVFHASGFVRGGDAGSGNLAGDTAAEPVRPMGIRAHGLFRCPLRVVGAGGDGFAAASCGFDPARLDVVSVTSMEMDRRPFSRTSNSGRLTSL